jgi:hypothetical protein
MDKVLSEVAERAGTEVLERAVEYLDECIARGVIERALGGEADGVLELVNARDTIITYIAAAQEGDL